HLAHTSFPTRRSSDLQVIADPSHRQIGQNFISQSKLVEIATSARGGAQRCMGLAYPFGFAGGTRGVEHHRHVIAAACTDLVEERSEEHTSELQSLAYL